MMRSLWTAASGMTSQQTAVDVIANNLANVNTTGYKTQSAQFKTLLYQTSQSVTTSANGDTKPVGAQVGLGVRNSAISTIFTQGNITSTELDTDFAIDGKGFFQLEDENGDILYTRNGSFTWSPMNDGTMMLCSSEGYGVLDTTGLPITLDDTYNMSKVTIDKDGERVQVPVTVGMQSDYYVEISGDNIEEGTVVYYSTPMVNNPSSGDSSSVSSQDGVTFNMGGGSMGGGPGGGGNPGGGGAPGGGPGGF